MYTFWDRSWEYLVTVVVAAWAAICFFGVPGVLAFVQWENSGSISWGSVVLRFFLGIPMGVAVFVPGFFAIMLVTAALHWLLGDR